MEELSQNEGNTRRTREEINVKRRERYVANRENINNLRREQYAASKDSINEIRRQKYARKKEDINRKRREQYAAKKRQRATDNHLSCNNEKDSISNVMTMDEYQILQMEEEASSSNPPNKRVRRNEKGNENMFLSNKRKVISPDILTLQRLQGCGRRTSDSIISAPIQSVPATCVTRAHTSVVTSQIERYSSGNRTTRINRNSMNLQPSKNSIDDILLEDPIQDIALGASINNNNSMHHDPRTLVLQKVPPCKYCGAYKFYKESEHFCCSKGQITLADTVLPDYMIRLLTSTDTTSKNFQNMIRTYNNHFAFTSIGMMCDDEYEHRDQGIYTVRVQGQVHHYINDLLPHDPSMKIQGIQFYFYEPDQQVLNRLSMLPRLDPTIVPKLVEMLQSNPYSLFLKQASELDNVDQYRIVIRSEPDLDQRRFNKPTIEEVAGIWIEDENDDSNLSQLWDIRVYTKSGYSHKVQYYYGCYDPLQYVLMFPNGECGWHGNIARVGCSIRKKRTPSEIRIGNFNSFEEVLQCEEQGVSHRTFYDVVPQYSDEPSTSSQTRRRTTVSCREYYVYKMQIRANDRSYLLRFGRLLQQYVIDNYIKLESMRLAYHKMNQKKMRIEHYQGLIDSVVSGVPNGGKVGKRFYLPATFIGGPRDMRQRYLDSMALVQQFGKPDLFLTMTCNPNWPEIKELLQPGEESHNRPDLLARVFKAKLTILHDYIMSGNLFGKISSMVYVVEFQKRGLPHAHFLIILKPAYKYLTPEAYDRVVSAELPDEAEDPYFYSLVVRHMMHGPCGYLNMNNVCMKDGKCKNHYPKNFNDYTTHGKGSYPIYRRRNSGITARVRGKTLDNRWVIPFNPTLLLLFNCHINVEICCDIRAVKYLYKYVHKGHDKISFRIATNSTGGEIDEIASYQNARWVSPVEATWRIFGFHLHGMYPAVMQLQVHLPNFQTVLFEDDADLNELLQDERRKCSMLTEFFEMNKTNVEAKQLNLLYKEFPRYYVWDNQSRIWERRKKRPVIGRLAVVNPIENERYYLRILLNNVRCPTSFKHLLTVDGKTCFSFQESAQKRGLLQNDDDMNKTMEEASLYRMPAELRRLFATLLHYCKPSNAKKLFEDYYDHMAEDFKQLHHQLKLTERGILEKVLQGINDTLESLGRDINEYRLVSFKYAATEYDKYTREITAEKNIPIPNEDLYAVHDLNHQQSEAFNIIYNRAMTNSGGVFFIDGPGGTGKSFLYKVLLAHIRAKGFVALIVASSGIAASEFLGGRTAHSRFKIPIDGGQAMQCNISFQSSEADLIRNSRIIIWDEAPMANKSTIHSVNNLLQFLCENNRPFGGKLVVFGGDFRQVLPIIRGGSRKEQIEASIVTSYLWNHFFKIELTVNMRARQDPGFVDFLMRVGNGEEPTNLKDEIEIPHPMLIPYTIMEDSIEALISFVYPDLTLFEKDPFAMMKRAILCPKNEYVDDINSKLIQRIPGKEIIYTSDDRAKNFTDQGDYIDYLNSLEPKGLPQHKLLLRVNSPVILLRNINPVEGLCNGTRLICKHMMPNVVGAVIAVGQFKGKLVWIPRIPLETKPSDNKYCIPFIRRQIPLRLCFAMTINKSQGQTLDCVGLYLKQPVFSHGQLYVGLSRAKTGRNVKVLIIPPTCNDPGTKYTKNIVYNEFLEKASSKLPY